MKVEIKSVTKESLDDILALDVSEKQQSFVESTEECLSDSRECNFYRPVGLYEDGVLVGFAMYGFFPDSDGDNKKGRVWLDRYLIDEKYQNHGLGHIMLDKLIDHLVKTYNCDEIYLSLYEDNKRALHIYEKFGFEFNGENDINGEKIMVKKFKNN